MDAIEKHVRNLLTQLDDARKDACHVQRAMNFQVGQLRKENATLRAELLIARTRVTRKVKL